MIRATVISDASHCPQSKVAGWAAWVRVDGIEAPIKGSGILKPKTPSSTYAEVYAALNGIWLAARRGAQIVLIQSDCMAVIHLCEGRGKLLPIWRKALSRPDMPHILAVSGRHVKGHTDNKDSRSWVNRWCDEEAGIAMRRARRKRKNAR